VSALLKPWLQEGTECLIGMGSISISIQWAVVANQRQKDHRVPTLNKNFMFFTP